MAGSDTINLAAQTHTLKYGLLYVDDDLTVQGQGMTSTVIDGSGRAAGIWDVDSTGFVMNDLTVTGGTATRGGLVYGSFADISLEDVLLTDGVAQHGGAVYAASGALAVDACSLDGNQASSSGGAIYSTATLTLSDSTISNNDATWGGGVHASLSDIAITGSWFEDNTATGSAGGLALGAQGTTSFVTDTTFSNNSAAGSGGGLYVAGSSTHAVVLDGLSVINNRAAYAGGLYLPSGRVVLTNSDVEGNQATVQGGGLYMSYVEVSDTTVRENTAPVGGGIYVKGQATLDRTSILDSTQGGGIRWDSWRTSQTLTLTNSTVSGNVGSDSGGIRGDRWSASMPTGVAYLTNVTVADNSASAGTGGVSSLGSGHVVLANVALEGNNGGNPDCDAVTSVGSTLVNDTTGWPVTSVGSGDLLNSSASPGALTTTTAPGSQVHPITTSSKAAYNGASTYCSTEDQLGITRSTCSIGSVEP